MWNVISLDGCFEGKKPWDLDFHQTVWGKELQDHSVEQLKTADMIIFGSKTYKGMADYWSTAKGEPETSYMNRTPKIVCSTTLKSAEWGDTTIVRDAVAEIPKLKQQGGGNMFIFGSGILSESLMKAGLSTNTACVSRRCSWATAGACSTKACRTRSWSCSKSGPCKPTALS